MTQATDDIEPIRLQHIEISYFLDPSGKPRVTTHFEGHMDNGDHDHSDVVIRLGMLRIAEDVLLNAAFGRE